MLQLSSNKIRKVNSIQWEINIVCVRIFIAARTFNAGMKGTVKKRKKISDVKGEQLSMVEGALGIGEYYCI